MTAPLRALGLMSGASLDGVDAALIETDGVAVASHGPAATFPLTRAQRTFALRAIKAALEARDAAPEIGDAARAITRAHIDAVAELRRLEGDSAPPIDVIGFHGQTILHRAPRDRLSIGRSWQVGDAQTLADAAGAPVVADFRSADIAERGQGAPLAPVYHAALARSLGETGPIAVVNIGGVANITFVAASRRDEDLIAFDCGPGNGLIDQWMSLKTGAAMDVDGAAALGGTVHEPTLRMMALAPFVRRPPPKSLDRYDFKLAPVEGLSVEDGAATLCAFTARCIALGGRHLPETPALWIIAGGGRRNPALTAALSREIEGPVAIAEDVGWRGDHLEAECFAFLAVRSLYGLPISFPRTTGAPRPLCGGVLFHPAAA